MMDDRLKLRRGSSEEENFIELAEMGLYFN